MIEVAVWDDWATEELYVKINERDRFGNKGWFNFHTGRFEMQGVNSGERTLVFPKDREELLRKLIDVFEKDVGRSVERRAKAVLKEEQGE